MINPSKRRLGGFVLAIALLPAIARSQSIARSFEELQELLRAEQIVVVIDRAGQETRGMAVEISASSLVLLVPEKTSSGLAYTSTGAKRTFDEDAVAEILKADPSGRKGPRIYLALPRTFQDLQQSLKAGQEVILTDDRGGQIRGKVAELSASALVVLGREKRTFAEDNVREVRLLQGDPTWNGTLIGMGVGALGGVLFITAASSACNAGCEGPAVSEVAGPFAGLGAGIGALVGYLVDRARTGETVVYSAPMAPRAQPRVTFSPVLGKDRRSMLVSVRF
jgi:hypothetical protein